MTDCTNGEIRDCLPDLLAGTLSAAEQATVEAHVASCADCAEELALLRVVRVIRPQPIAVDVAAIAAHINRRGDTGSVPAINSTGVRSIASAPSRRRAFHASRWSWAAAITLMAVGGLSVMIARRGTTALVPVAGVDTLMGAPGSIVGVASPVAAAESAAGGAPRATMTRITGAEPAALSVGELSEYSDAELEGVLKKLEAWDGTASTDPLLPVPLVNPSGSTP